MARKSKKATPTSASNSDLGLSELRVRLDFLNKENEKILKQIEKKRSELKNLAESIETIAVEVAQRTAPFRQKLLELDAQIHAAFKEIFAGRKLGKKSKKDIERLYYQMQFDGVISPNRFHGYESFDVEEPGDETDWEDDDEARSHSGDYRDLTDLPKPDRDELKKIRQTFLRLAEIFHPDKVSDEAEKEHCTEVMKEINQAYKNGDLAKLLAIEKQQSLGEAIDRDSSDDLTRECAKVEAENAFLKEQLATLQLQLRKSKNSQQGAIAGHFKKMAKIGLDPIAEALAEVEAQIAVFEELHKFIADFRDRRITIKEFLRGPVALMPQDEDDMSDEELLLEFLSRY
jgi:hypothetical protein